MKINLYYFTILILFSLFILVLNSVNIYAFEGGFSFFSLYLSLNDTINIYSIYFDVFDLYTYDIHKENCWGFLFYLRIMLPYWIWSTGEGREITDNYKMYTISYFVGISFPIVPINHKDRISMYPQLSIGIEYLVIYGQPIDDLPGDDYLGITPICLVAKLNSFHQTMTLGLFIKNITGFIAAESLISLNMTFYWYLGIGISF